MILLQNLKKGEVYTFYTIMWKGENINHTGTFVEMNKGYLGYKPLEPVNALVHLIRLDQLLEVQKDEE